MQSLPRTPSKADDGIESLKLSLTAKWGIQFPERGSTWSPSHRDPNRSEDKIHNLIQFLYFRDAVALGTAISNFEGNAINVHSEWQYKAKAEVDVIPHRATSRNRQEGNFLRKQTNISAATVKELTESLLHHVSSIADRVKRGEKFSKVDVVRSEHFRHSAVLTLVG